jgi:hypothetical protein
VECSHAPRPTAAGSLFVRRKNTVSLSAWPAPERILMTSRVCFAAVVQLVFVAKALESPDQTCTCLTLLANKVLSNVVQFPGVSLNRSICDL